MRGSSARAALRALRTTTSTAVTSSRVAPVRALCVQAPPVIKDATAVEPPIVAHSTHDPATVIPEASTSIPAELVANVLQAAPESAAAAAEGDISVGDDVTLSVKQNVETDELTGTQLFGEVVDDASNDVTNSGDGGSYNQRRPRYKFLTPQELTLHLEKLLEKKGSRSAMWHFRHALEQEGSPLLSTESVGLMLPVMARGGWFQTTQDALLVAEERGFELTTVEYNCALFAMMRKGNIQLLEETIGRMSSGRSRPNATSFNLLIGAYFYKGSVDDAFGVLQAMKAANIYPTIATYQTLVSGCLRHRDTQKAYDTLFAIDQQGMTVSAMTVALVLVAAANDDNYDQITTLLGKLEETLPMYTADVDRISAKRSMYSSKHVKTSLHHRESIRGSPRLEMSALNALMHSAFRGGRPDIAVRVWNIIAESYPDQPHTADHWYSLIGALAVSGDFSAAFDAVGRMRAAGHTPSVRHLSVPLIRRLAINLKDIDDQYYRLVEHVESMSSGDPAVATEAAPVENAEAAGEEAPIVEEQEDPATILASADASEPDITDAKPDEDIAKDLSENVSPVEAPQNPEADPKPSDSPSSLSEVLGANTVSSTGLSSFELPWAGKPRAPVGMTEFNCVISACALAWDLDRAFQTYDEACGRLGLTRDHDTLNALLDGCVQTRHMRGGARILAEIRNEGFALDPETLALGVRLHLRGRKGKEALELIKEAVAEGRYVPARTFQMVAKHLSRFASQDMARECVDLAVQQGYRSTIFESRDHSRNLSDRQQRNVVDGSEDNERDFGLDRNEEEVTAKAESDSGSFNKVDNNST